MPFHVPYSLILALGAAGIVALLVPPSTRLAWRLGAVAQPGPRHVHREPVPRLGGLAMTLAVLVVAWLAVLLPGPGRMLDRRHLVGLTFAAIPVLALGLTDDIRGLGPLVKLALQTCAAMVLVLFGYGVPLLTNPLGGEFHSGLFNVPLTVVWTLLVMNAINLIDGLDGLAAGVVLIASMTLWWAGRLHADVYVMFLVAPLAGATFGFLFHNFPRARVFMGDTGSQFLGLALSAATLLENRKGTATVTLLFPLVALGLPIADGMLAFARRSFHGRPVFRADSGHIHHRLLSLGLTPTQATLALWSLSALLGLTAIVLAQMPRGFGWILLVLMALALVLAFEMLEAIERPSPPDETHRD
ncbi:MAG: glycosyltransferase family 4 protein [Candidatus Eisenbacteria bacterium]